jgi:mRNA-degrading endonuclease RelE of RelBE toxin-antitoxin system
MTTIRAAHPSSGKITGVTNDYVVLISAEIEGRMRRCHAAVRMAIQERLAEIAVSAGNNRRRRAKALEQKHPPLRFYVYEGYRIAYQLDSASRRVVVLDIQLLPVD